MASARASYNKRLTLARFGFGRLPFYFWTKHSQETYSRRFDQKLNAAGISAIDTFTAWNLLAAAAPAGSQDGIGYDAIKQSRRFYTRVNGDPAQGCGE